MKAYRHGDLALTAIKELPKGLKKSKTKILMTGSGGNHHSINRGKVYFKGVDDFIFGYLVAKNTVLFHPEHGKKVRGKALKGAKVEDGIYELRKQVEHTHDGFVPVVD